MAIQAFLVLTKIGGGVLPGESTDPYFGGSKFRAVEIGEFSFGIHHTTTIGSGTAGAGPGRAQFTDLKITKVVDGVSSDLFQYAAGGTHLQQLDLYIRKAGSPNTAAGYLRFSFKLVYVTDLEWSYNDPEVPEDAAVTKDADVTENVTFAYGALQIAYTTQGADGRTSQQPPASWNVVGNDNNFNDPHLN